MTSYRPSFSRDGKWIYFSSRWTGPTQIYRVPFAGGAPVLMIASGTDARESWDGKSVYYQSGLNGEGLYVRALPGGPERKLLGSVPNRAYAVGKDGIYYAGAPDANGRFALLRFDTATSKSHLPGMLGGFGLYTNFSTSPDGSVSYHATSRERNRDMRLVEHFQ